jgi:hypothetical protein
VAITLAIVARKLETAHLGADLAQVCVDPIEPVVNSTRQIVESLVCPSGVRALHREPE